MSLVKNLSLHSLLSEFFYNGCFSSSACIAHCYYLFVCFPQETVGYSEVKDCGPVSCSSFYPQGSKQYLAHRNFSKRMLSRIGIEKLTTRVVSGFLSAWWQKGSFLSHLFIVQSWEQVHPGPGVRREQSGAVVCGAFRVSDPGRRI